MSRFHWQSHIDEVDDDGIYCHSRRNNVVVAFGTLSSFFTYLLIVSGVVWVVCPFCRWWKKWQHSSWSSVIGIRSYQPQYPRCSTPLNPQPPPSFPFPPPFFLSSHSPFLFLFLWERRNVLRRKIQKTCRRFVANSLGRCSPFPGRWDSKWGNNFVVGNRGLLKATSTPSSKSLMYSQSHLGWHFRKLKAQSSNVSFATFRVLPLFSQKRRSSFELWALKQHAKMSPQVGLAVQERKKDKLFADHVKS